VSDHDTNEETIASLLHTIALIREAAGCEGVMLAELPSKIATLRADLAKATAELDEARREVCELLATISQTTSRPTQPLNIANWRGWNCFDAKEANQ
jgi:hypothetical protein